MQQMRLDYPLDTICALFDVSRSGYYTWLKRKPSKREQEEPRLVAELKASHRRNLETYGPERLQDDLADHGIAVGVHRIKRRRKDHGIRCKQKRRYKTTTNSRHDLPVAANHLDQKFVATAPNQVWVTDITYIRTYQGWLYLAVVIDLYSRMVVGWSMKPSMHRDIVLDALMMGLKRRQPRDEVLIHSDQGSQFVSDDWSLFASRNGFKISMSRRGNCWDNACAESFFSSLKKERVRRRIYPTHEAARADLFDYIEVLYNRKRRHSHLGQVSPANYEAKNQAG